VIITYFQSRFRVEEIVLPNIQKVKNFFKNLIYNINSVNSIILVYFESDKSQFSSINVENHYEIINSLDNPKFKILSNIFKNSPKHKNENNEKSSDKCKLLHFL
jgi:hypothetical protein